jgi:hypothetical protein
MRQRGVSTVRISIRGTMKPPFLLVCSAPCKVFASISMIAFCEFLILASLFITRTASLTCSTRFRAPSKRRYNPTNASSSSSIRPSSWSVAASASDASKFLYAPNAPLSESTLILDIIV